ncbi:DUF4083 domain-containing protein [Lentibacillus sp. CBA3610]|nr:DUF4083 domain-containing protein [Lentibacillus sp. CBA3610]
MGGWHLGDVAFQLVFLVFWIVIIVLIVSAFRSLSKRSKQMDRIEKKLDAVSEQVKKNN